MLFYTKAESETCFIFVNFECYFYFVINFFFGRNINIYETHPNFQLYTRIYICFGADLHPRMIY